MATKKDRREVHAVNDDYEGSVGKRFSNAIKEFSLRKRIGSLNSLRLDVVPKGLYVTKDNRVYGQWWNFIILMSVYSSWFTPFQFGFFTGLPRALWILDLCAQVPFILDLILHFFTAYKDPKTFRLVADRRKIALRYFKGFFVLDLLACLPWDSIYKGTGHHEAVRCLVWFRIFRFLRVMHFFTELEKDIRINYFWTRIMKLVAVEIFVTHFAACFYYYLATTVKTRSQSYTWLGSLTLGDFSYENFREISIGKTYVTSLYWSIQAITTVGYGDIHAVNIREMIFIMIFISVNMLIGAYLLGNVTALVVKASATQIFRDRMASVVNYINKHQLPQDLRRQMRSHVKLQFESGALTEDEIVGQLPSILRSKVANSIYKDVVQRVPIFKGTSADFLDEIVSRVSEEHYLPGEVVVHQGRDSESFFLVYDGKLEEILVHEDGKVEVVQEHSADSAIGEVGVLCNIPQPFTVRVTGLRACRLLRLEKRDFNGLVQIYFNDGRLVINNLLEYKDTDARIGQIASEVAFLVAKHAAELTLIVCNAVSQGDLNQLKHLVQQGAQITRADYDGRTPLHIAAARGNEALALYLIREGADVNAVDKFGITPLQEAVKSGNDQCISALLEQRATLKLNDPGPILCNVVYKNQTDKLRRLLMTGADPSAADYDLRTPLHIASSEGQITMAKMLIDAGADLHFKDRWGRTPLDEAKQVEDESLIPTLKETAEKRTLTDRPSGGSRRLGEIDTSIHSQSASSLPPMHASSGRRSDTTSQFEDLDGDSVHYRLMPIRAKGRPPRSNKPPGPSSLSSDDTTASARKRVTIFPFHPRTTTDEQPAGRVAWVPSSIAKILEMAKEQFGKSGTKVLNEHGGEITSTDFIMDNEKLYVVD